MKSEWDHFVKNLDRGHFFFQRDFMDYHADRFTDHSLLFYIDEKLKAVLPANQREAQLWSHQGLTFGGLLFQDLGAKKVLDCLDAVVKYAADQSIDEICYKAIPNIYGAGTDQADLFALQYLNFELYRRDVSSTVVYALNKKIRKGKKANYTRGKRLGFELQKVEDITDYWAVLNGRLQQDYGVNATHSLDEMNRLSHSFPDNIHHFVITGENNEVLAGATIFLTGKVAHTQYLTVSDQGREMGALDFLIVSLIERYKETCDYFDFGISTEDQGKKLNEGLIFQKEGFGAKCVVHDFYRKKIG